MTLAPGSRVGGFEILALAGKGGMGEVYRAHDTQLNRDVAIKVLPEALAREPQRLARFQREAQLLAALNHPNIAGIYGLHQEGSTFCLVMEYVPGADLRGPLKLDEALRVARQVADGLEEAHSKPIIHRDLKPANIKLTPDGKVKILDFGLAKAMGSSVPEDSDATLTMAAGETREGTILGTPAYMSPEQARGEKSDHRVDIWAFGCVLFEALTGKRAFEGKTTIDILSAVLNTEPNWAALPANTPAATREVLELCLRKDAARRLQSIADARVLLDRTAASGVEAAAKPAGKAKWWLAAAVVAALAMAGVGWMQALRVPVLQTFTGERLGGSTAAYGPSISPDGQTLAFIAMVDRLTQVAVMKPGSGNWQVLTHDRTRGYVNDISWSLDGSKLYYSRYQNLPMGVYSVPVLGGEERLLIEDATTARALPDGSFLFGRLNAQRRNQLHRFWPETGRVQMLKALLGPADNVDLKVTPRGDQAVLFGVPLDQPDVPLRLYAMDLASEKLVQLAPDTPGTGGGLAITPLGSGALFFTRNGDGFRLMRTPLDGSPTVETLLTLATATIGLDASGDGSIYVTEFSREAEALLLSAGASGGTPERVASEVGSGALGLPGGRFLFPQRRANKWRLMVAKAGQAPEPFVQTQDATSGPAAMAGPNQIAFLIGTGAAQAIALASMTDGRLIRRLEGAKGASVSSLTASADGSTLYYTASGSVWSIPATDGTPKKLHAGDSVTMDPYRNDLVIGLFEKEAVRLVRLPLSGAPEQVIPMEPGIRVAPDGMHPHAVGKDGTILVRVTMPDNWFWPAGLLNPQTGKVKVVDVGYDSDTASPGWTPDGKIILTSVPLRSVLWRYRPDAGK